MIDDKRITNYHKVGLALVATGLIFALETFFKVQLLYKAWPIILTIIGTGFIKIHFIRQGRNAVFLGVGVYVILFSLLAIYCNMYSWAHLAYLWPLFISFAGISFLSVFCFNQKNKMYLLLALILLSISVIFFIVFTVSARWWWTIFILIGASILATGKDNA